MSFKPQPPMPSQNAFEKLAEFDQLMALGPDEQIPANIDHTFIRNRVIEKWFSRPSIIQSLTTHFREKRFVLKFLT